MPSEARDERSEEASDRLSDLLPEGFVSLGVVVGIKCLNEDGEISLATHRSADITSWEALGILVTLIDDIKQEMRGEDE